MILAYFVIFLVLAAWLLGRDLSAIGKISFRGGWKFIALIVFLYIVQARLIVYVSGQTFWQLAILILSNGVLILLFVINRHLPGATLFALGVLFNVLVMVANGGWMPITPDTYHYVHPERSIELQSRPPNSKNIILRREETNLWFLSDIVRMKLGRRWALSIGDFVLTAGIAQFIFQTTARKEKKRPGWADAYEEGKPS